MQTCITKYMVRKNTYMYLACKLEVHMQVVSKQSAHNVLELCLYVECLPKESLPGGLKKKNPKTCAQTKVAYLSQKT